jgi:hypothetical protein
MMISMDNGIMTEMLWYLMIVLQLVSIITGSNTNTYSDTNT